MPDKIVTEDPTNPGVLKVNGPTLGPDNKILLSDLDVTGAANGDVIELVAGVWTASATTSSDTASNLGAGNGVFASKVANDFQFKSLIAGTNITITPTGTDLTIDSTSGGVGTPDFTSALQVITSGGGLTIAHGLGVRPNLVVVQLECVGNDVATGYLTGDVCVYTTEDANSGSPGYGMSVIPDATNLNIRIGNAPSPISLLNKNTGLGGGPTLNANFQIRFLVWA